MVNYNCWVDLLSQTFYKLLFVSSILRVLIRRVQLQVWWVGGELSYDELLLICWLIVCMCNEFSCLWVIKGCSVILLSSISIVLCCVRVVYFYNKVSSRVSYMFKLHGIIWWVLLALTIGEFNFGEFWLVE